MQHAGFATGLSEIGTTRLCCHYYPNYVAPSVDSLAAPGSIKRTRKQLLVAIDGAKHGHSLASQKIDDVWGRIPRWGEETVDDFVTLYILKHLGDSAMAHRAIEIPERVRTAAQELQLSFMERFDPELLNTIPDRYRTQFVDRLSEAGIELYGDGDLDEFYAVGDLLRETRVPKPDSHSRPHPVAVALERVGLHTLVDPARRIRALAENWRRGK